MLDYGEIHPNISCKNKYTKLISWIEFIKKKILIYIYIYICRELLSGLVCTLTNCEGAELHLGFARYCMLWFLLLLTNSELQQGE